MNSTLMLLIFKIFLLFVMGFYFYYVTKIKKFKLSYRRYKTNYFPNLYKINSFYNLLKSIIIIILYWIIFILGFFVLRFIGSGRLLDLKLIFVFLKFNLLNNFWFDSFLDLLLILSLILIYLKVFSHLMKWIKLHRVRLHIFLTARTTYYTKLFYELRNYDLFCIIRKICELFSYSLYFMHMKTIPGNYEDLHTEITKKNRGKFEKFLIGYLYSKYKKIHYHFFICVLLYDIFFNDMILYNIYIILPYIYLYELAVKYSNIFIYKNLVYDYDLYFIIHYPITDVDDIYVTYQRHTIERIEVKTIINEYVSHKFIDKKTLDIFETTLKENFSFNFSFKFLEKISQAFFLESLLLIFISIVLITISKI